jgi:translation elongation factor EF-Tu-like GTPase
MSNTLSARIRFLLPSEGGRSTPAMSGVRPQLKLGEVLTSCVVSSKNEDQVFELGREYEVTLRLVFPEQYGQLVRFEMPVELFEGSRLVARGEFVSI